METSNQARSIFSSSIASRTVVMRVMRELSEMVIIGPEVFAAYDRMVEYIEGRQPPNESAWDVVFGYWLRRQ